MELHPPREAAWCRMPSMPAISDDTCMTACMVPWRRLTSTIRPSRSLSQSQAIRQAPFTISQIPMGTIFFELVGICRCFRAADRREIGGERRSAVRARQSESTRFIPARRASKPMFHPDPGCIPA